MQAVTKVFVELHKAGLIYKDKRLVNWDPHFQTAISDLEVEQREAKGSFKWTDGEKDKDGNPVAFDIAKLGKLLVRERNGHMYYFRYPLEGMSFDKNDPKTFVVVGTTRPETMLGDTAVAVHPENEKLKHLIGKKIKLPLVGRSIPVVGDDYADPEKGTGAVKITPAHDFNDFEVGKRHADKLAAPINIFDAFAKLNENVPKVYQGMDRFEARTKVVADLEAGGFLEKIEPNTHTVPHGDRSGVPVEPWLTDQWYVNAGDMAKEAVAAVKDGRTKFVPERFANDYNRWLDPETIQPWCISRQLWWGHQIPAWYGPTIRRRGTSPLTSLRKLTKRFVAVRRNRGRRTGAGPLCQIGLRQAVEILPRRSRCVRMRRAAAGNEIGSVPRPRRPRHLVLVGTVAVLHARLAGENAGTCPLLSNPSPRHRLRHHLLLGRPHDDGWPALQRRHHRQAETAALQDRLHPRPRARRQRAPKCRSRRATSSTPST